jgi:hypothetical protein
MNGGVRDEVSGEFSFSGNFILTPVVKYSFSLV